MMVFFLCFAINFGNNVPFIVLWNLYLYIIICIMLNTVKFWFELSWKWKDKNKLLGLILQKISLPRKVLNKNFKAHSMLIFAGLLSGSGLGKGQRWATAWAQSSTGSLSSQLPTASVGPVARQVDFKQKNCFLHCCAKWKYRPKFWKWPNILFIFAKSGVKNYLLFQNFYFVP